MIALTDEDLIAVPPERLAGAVAPANHGPPAGHRSGREVFESQDQLDCARCRHALFRLVIVEVVFGLRHSFKVFCELPVTEHLALGLGGDRR